MEKILQVIIQIQRSTSDERSLARHSNNVRKTIDVEPNYVTS